MSFTLKITLKYMNYFWDCIGFRHEHRIFSLSFSEFGCHQPVKLRIARELVDKRHKGTADF